jgi:hypothetical protein
MFDRPHRPEAPNPRKPFIMLETYWLPDKGRRPIPAELVPLAAHFCAEGYTDISRAEILDYTQDHGHLPPVDWFDCPADYAEAFTHFPSPIAGGSDDTPRSQYTDAEWARRMSELPDDY